MVERVVNQGVSPERKPRPYDYEAFRSHLITVTNGINSIPRNEPVLDLPQSMRVTQLLRHPSAQNMKEYVRERAVPLSLMDSDILFPTRSTLQDEVESLGGYVPDHSENRHRVARFLCFTLDFAKRIDATKCRALGRTANTSASNYIIALSLERAGWLTALKEYSNFKDDPNSIVELAGLGDKLMQEESPYLAWYGPKISLFTTGVANAFNLAKHLESLPPSSVTEQEQSAIEHLRAENDDLFAETRALSTYGVKSAIAPALSNGNMKEWLVLDSLLEKADYEGIDTDFKNLPSKYIEPSVANFIGTASRFVSSKLRYERKSNPNNNAAIVWSKTDEVLEDQAADMFIIRLGQDGHLRTAYGHDLREYFGYVGAGMYEYEQMRAELLSIYADLVTPVWVQELAEDDIKLSRRDKGLSPLKPTEKPHLYDLVLARKRVIKTFKDDIVGELQDELEKHVEVKKESGKREMAKHVVVGHLRKIADNHRASPEARKIAWEEDGRILPEFGWTWQRTHERGSLPNESRGHRIRFTNPSVVRQMEHRADTITDKGDIFKAYPDNSSNNNVGAKRENEARKKKKRGRK